MMRERFFDPGSVFDHPATMWMVVGVAVALAVTPVVTWGLGRAGVMGKELRREVMVRWGTWVVLCAILFVPIALGPGWWVIGVTALSLACYREYARLTGLFRHRVVSATVAIGIVLVGLASLDHWYGLFAALGPLVVAVVVTAALLRDEPSGYIQRTALGVFGMALFGVGLGHVGYLANDGLWRPMVVWLLVCVEMNDIFAFVCGKAWGKRKLAPKTSPGKTTAGAAGAVVCTTVLAAAAGRAVFAGTEIGSWVHVTAMGLIISVAGQAGDLMLSSIKRDLGVKDTSRLLPGHGGLLDRFDSLLLAGPAVFYYIGYFKADGVGLEMPTRLLTGGG